MLRGLPLLLLLATISTANAWGPTVTLDDLFSAGWIDGDGWSPRVRGRDRCQQQQQGQSAEHDSTCGMPSTENVTPIWQSGP